MKKVVIGAMAVLALTACSNEEVIQTNEQNQEISFSAVTGKSLSRAADGYCNNATPATFQVAAAYTTDGSAYAQYFINDGYKKSVLDTDPGYANHKNYVATGSVRYWPELGTATDTKKLKFFAYLNASPEWVTTAPDAYKAMKADFTVATLVKDQVDFIYAVEEAQEKPAAGQLAINFRHALSQIEFRAKNANNKIHVIVDGVKVVNVKNTGTFTMKAVTSGNGTLGTGNYEDHTTGANFGTADTDSRVGRGEWSDQSGSASYEVATDGDVVLTSDAKNLTAETGKEFTTRSMYLLPQELTPWDGTGAAASQAKSYFMIKALIYNIADAGGTVHTNTDVVLWGGKDTSDNWITKYIAVPAPSVTWEDGKRYVYTFVFTTNGNGGSDPTTGDPVLTPIKLEITVDDFVDVENTNVEMKDPTIP